ncbi:MAG: DUF6483 family protein [Anaerolineae bacterium]
MRRENDYLLRLIKELASVIHYALGLRLEQKYDLAHDTMNQSARDVLGLNLDSVVQLGADTVVANLQLTDGSVWQAKTAVLAWLLYEDGVMYFEEGEEEWGYGRHLTALHFLLTLSAANWEPDDHIPAVESVRESLDDFILPAATYHQLIAHYERHGQFGDAEDVLYTWLENRETAAQANTHADPVAAGFAFYHRLLQKDDETLQAGNLPRAEIETGLAELGTGG